jgi:VanZ family protein
MADTGQHSIFFTLVKEIPNGDKLGHFILFGLLSLGAIFSTQFKKTPFIHFVPIGSFIVFSFTLLEEGSQYFLSHRTFDLTDLYADILGIMTFTLVAKTIAQKNKTPKKIL